jgi:hypothetical protein
MSRGLPVSNRIIQGIVSAATSAVSSHSTVFFNTKLLDSSEDTLNAGGPLVKRDGCVLYTSLATQRDNHSTKQNQQLPLYKARMSYPAFIQLQLLHKRG